MKILIISGAFYPENSPRSFRSTELVKQFCRLGHEVTYVGRYDDELHVEFVKEHGFTFIDVGPKKWKLFSTKNKLFSKPIHIVNRLLELFLEYPDLEWTVKLPRVLNKLQGFDLMISVAVPHPIHWGVACVHSKSSKVAKTWVADCGDSYYLNQLDSFRKPFYFKWMEQRWCRKVDYISNPMDAMKTNFLPEFHDKCVEIPQGFKIEESEKYLKPYHKNAVPTFCFSGSFIPGSRDPRPLLEFLTRLDIDFKWHIFTRNSQYVLPYMVKAGNRIEIHDYVPRPKLLELQSKMDFLINFTFDPQLQVPSKLIDYLITTRPILNIDKELDTNNVLAFLNGDFSARFDKISLDRYRIESVCDKFLKLAQ